MPPSHRSTARYRGTFLAVLLLSLLLARPRTGDAAQRLQNGGFEDGVNAWNASIGFSTGGCPARSGNIAGVLTTVNQFASVQQLVPGVPGEGDYRLTGYVRALSGQVTLTANLQWQEPDGRTAGGASAQVPVSATYEPFSITATGRTGMVAVIARLSMTSTSSAPAAICLDDLALDGAPLSAPTATPTPTLSPSPTPTLTPTLPASSLTPSPTSILASPTATRTPLPGSTPATAVPPSTAQSLSFSNGGFEDGLSGWEKFGGELQAVGEPHHGGSRAAALVSSTSSTKWAYQVVRLEPGLALEFSGYVLPGPGIDRAYLRISWYTSTDGSGAAFATDDSTTVLPGNATAYQPLTTGPRVPPTTARSARLRVMLVPASASEARLYLDDFAVVMAPPPPAAPPPSTSLAPDEPANPSLTTPAIVASETPFSASPAGTRTPIASTATRPPSTLTPARPTASPVVEVEGLRQERPTAIPTTRAPAFEAPARRSAPTLAVVSLGLLVGIAGGGGIYLWNRTHRP